MNRILVMVFVLATVGMVGACSSNNAPVQTNANTQNLNANTAPSNTGVVTNNNGNENTSGVRPINDNGNSNGNNNSNQRPGNKNQ